MVFTRMMSCNRLLKQLGWSAECSAHSYLVSFLTSLHGNQSWRNLNSFSTLDIWTQLMRQPYFCIFKFWLLTDASLHLIVWLLKPKAVPFRYLHFSNLLVRRNYRAHHFRSFRVVSGVKRLWSLNNLWIVQVFASAKLARK
jgi:hypothetical protein